MLQKSALYETWGIRQILVIDPQARQVWSFSEGSPKKTGVVARRGDQIITAPQLGAEVDKRLSRF